MQCSRYPAGSFYNSYRARVSGKSVVTWCNTRTKQDYVVKKWQGLHKNRMINKNLIATFFLF